jgi:hypothetical protein
MTSELLSKTRTDKQGIKLEDGSIDGSLNVEKLECRKGPSIEVDCTSGAK